MCMPSPSMWNSRICLSWVARAQPQPRALRNIWSPLSSNASSTHFSRERRPPARNSAVVSVLPVPVAPDTSVIESLNSPPPHMSSSCSLPDVTRVSDERDASSMLNSGITRMPAPGSTVKGYSPLRSLVPRSLSTSTVRRRFSSSSKLRKMTTLSATNSSTPRRATGPESSGRSTVMTTVTPSPRSSPDSQRSCCRLALLSPNCAITVPSESIETRVAPIDSTACRTRATSAAKSKSPRTTCSGPTAGAASTTRQLPAASQAATSQPSDIRLARRSSAGSSNVTNTPGSPRRMPSARNCAREDRIGAARRTGDEGGPALGQAAVGDVVEPGDAGQQLGQPAVRHHAVVGARVGVGHSSASCA